MTAGPAPRYLAAGECALAVEFGDTIDEAIHDRVMALDAALAEAQLDGVTETVPTYRSLLIHFDPARLSTAELSEVLRSLDAAGPARAPPRTLKVPACYDPPFAEDLDTVAAALGLSADAVIDLHCGATYRVYMYGFAPGYTFLGGLPRALSIPRRATPRPPVPSGSLLIAGGQALIASCAMPTGWHQIGRTPLRVFDPTRIPMVFAAVGDIVCFERIDAARFAALAAADAPPLEAPAYG